jgi:hypothetical protein
MFHMYYEYRFRQVASCVPKSSLAKGKDVLVPLLRAFAPHVLSCQGVAIRYAS